MIYVECNNDTDTLLYLGYKYLIDFKHPHSKGNVLKAMRETNSSLGIIDEDPHGGKYPQLKSYPIIENQYNLKLRKNTDSNSKYLIEIGGELEEWLIYIANNLKIDPSNFGVLDSFGKFKKSFAKHEKHNFYSFLDAIQVHPSFETFRTWIENYYQT